MFPWIGWTHLTVRIVIWLTIAPHLSPVQRYDREQARLLLAAMAAGRLRLAQPQREGDQIRRLTVDGRVTWPPPPPGITILNRRQQAILADADEIPGPAPRRSTQSSLLPSRSSSKSERMVLVRPDASSTSVDPLQISPAPALVHMLVVLAAKSTPDRPLELMSLLRPPYRTGGFVHVGPLNPHSLGLAADIASFAGCDFRQDQPESCVRATLALLRALPPGRYRLGVTKAPETPLLVGRPPLPPVLAGWLPPGPVADNTAADCVAAALLGVTLGEPSPPPWPFFPPPQAVLDQGRVVATTTVGRPAGSIARATPEISSYRNESYLSAEELRDIRLRRALAEARRRGVEIIALFPDGADHIHIDVRQHP